MESKVMMHSKEDVLTARVAALFEQYHQAIFAYLFRLLDDDEWAHDLTQETFVKLLTGRDRLPEISNQRAWLYRIATNLAYNALKRRRRFAWLPWRQSDTSSLVADDPTAAVAQQQRVVKALAALPPEYRAPLLLYSHEGFNVREIAGALELSEGAVKTRLYRAREMFRQAYEPEVEREGGS